MRDPMFIVKIETDDGTLVRVASNNYLFLACQAADLLCAGRRWNIVETFPRPRVVWRSAGWRDPQTAADLPAGAVGRPS